MSTGVVMEGFEIDVQASGAHAVVVVTGDIDASTVPALEERLLELVGSGTQRVVVDLRLVGFIESVGLGLLVRVKKALAPADKILCLVIGEGQSNIRTPFEITRLDEVFPIHTTLEAAIEDCLTKPAA